MNVFLRPKNIIVVGGTGGIGFAAVRRLLEGGAKNVVIASRSVQKLEEARKKLIAQFGEKVSSHVFDISDVKTQEAQIEAIQKALGDDEPLDGLVISSGINFDGSNWKGFNISESDWDRVMDVNLKGAFFLIRNFSNYLHAHNRKGNICVVSSISSRRCPSHISLVCAPWLTPL